jgi:L-asparaginase II
MLIYSLLGLTLVLIGLMAMRFYRLHKAQSAQIIALEQQLAGLCAAAVGADERVVKFEQTLNKLKEQQNTLDVGTGRQQGYEHAIRLARKGVSVDQIVDNCNLSDEEARLISRLHGLQQRGGELH